MYPYCMREAQEPRRNALEVVAAVVAIAILGTCAVSDRPHLGRVTYAEQAKERGQTRQSIAQLQTMTQQLQTRDNTLEADLANVARSLQSTRAELVKLMAGQDTLGTQVTMTATRLRELEAAVQQTSERMAKFGDPGTVQQLVQQRDEAVAQSKQSNDQIRQLTLKLQRAGIYP